MNHFDNTPPGENSTSPEIYAARIGFIGALLSTLGDGLQSVGAGIALQQLENSSSQDTQNQSDQSNQIESMQKQIDQLTRKIEKMERGN
ncbi:hypothetical protein [Sporosarcina sp. ZBG7A]|uniref:hypothetical protein n=1 Tax=Sporosarcina sp. ZBG7A TaxID=1582223 RepID=UPI00057ABA7E|nr:hypothetical protein [Sporosarcina sp. ZBG7A]